MSHVLSWGYRRDEEGTKKGATRAAFARLMTLQHASFLCSCVGSNELVSIFHCTVTRFLSLFSRTAIGFCSVVLQNQELNNHWKKLTVTVSPKIDYFLSNNLLNF